MDVAAAIRRNQGYVFLEDADAVLVARLLGKPGAPKVLRPSRESEADSWSLSGTYGRGAFPWHTDGAISDTPPRWVLMRGLNFSHATSTELLSPDESVLSQLRRTVLRVTYRSGRARYLPAAVPCSSSWRLRWDPRIGSPKVGVAVEEIDSLPPTAVIHWEPGKLLVFDNQKLLHRRPSVPLCAIREIERTYVWSL